MGLYGARDFQMQATRVEVLQDAIVQNQNSGSAKHDQNVTTVSSKRTRFKCLMFLTLIVSSFFFSFFSNGITFHCLFIMSGENIEGFAESEGIT